MSPDLARLNAPADTRWGNLGSWQRARTYPQACEALATSLGRAAGLAPGQAVLDVGCGAGEQLALWRRGFGVTDVDAIDALAANVESAIRRAAWARVRIGDAVDLGGYDDGAFDRVVALDCAYHFAPRARFFREARRVLRPGGQLALTDLVLARPAREWRYDAVLRAACQVTAIPRANLCTEGVYAAELVAAGLEVVHCERMDDAVLGGFSRFVRHAARPARGWVAPVMTALGATLALRAGLLGYHLVVAVRAA